MEVQNTLDTSRRKSLKKLKKSINSNLIQYTEETTIHGLKYLGNKKHTLPERIFWILIFIISTLCLGYFIYKTCKAWIENPVTITDQTVPTQVFRIPFPSVTVCPAIKTKRNLFNLKDLTDELKLSPYWTFWNTDYGKKYQIASQVCRSTFENYSRPIFKAKHKWLHDTLSVLKKLEPETILLLNDLSPQRDEVVQKCRLSNWIWKEGFKYNDASDENCKSLFSTILTNEGVCFTFNTIPDVLRAESLQTDFKYYDMTQARDGWDPEQGYTKDKAFPYKGIVKGSPYESLGLRFVLIGNWSDTSLECETGNVGFKLVMHSPANYPHMYEQYLSLEYGKHYRISIVPKTIYTADNLRSFDPKTRQCFFNDERRLKYYTFYSAENCRLECYRNLTKKICFGTPFSLPRDTNSISCSLPYRNFGWDMAKYYASVIEYNKSYPMPHYSEDPTEIDLCNCLPECNSIIYNYKILDTFDDVGYEYETTNNDSDIRRTLVDIFFSEPDYIGQERVQVYTFEKLLSDFGGLLGLFMGGSVLSLFELIYFLTIRNCFK